MTTVGYLAVLKAQQKAKKTEENQELNPAKSICPYRN